jgi:hypothetical protein
MLPWKLQLLWCWGNSNFSQSVSQSRAWELEKIISVQSMGEFTFLRFMEKVGTIAYLR